MGVGREEQKEEEVCAKVNHPSSLDSSNNVSYASLIPGFPMCGPTPMTRVKPSLNKASRSLQLGPGLDAVFTAADVLPS